MAAEKLMAAQESDDAEAEFRLAESQIQIAKENREIARLEYRQQGSLLNLRTIRTPLNRIVVDQLLYPGEVVEPGGTKISTLKVAQIASLRIRILSPKEVFGKVTEGMTADVTPEIPSKSTYADKVKTIDRLVNATSGTLVVFLEMPNARRDVLAGKKCKADFYSIR